MNQNATKRERTILAGLLVTGAIALAGAGLGRIDAAHRDPRRLAACSHRLCTADGDAEDKDD